MRACPRTNGCSSRRACSRTTRRRASRRRGSHKLTGVTPLARVCVRRLVVERALPAHAERLAVAGCEEDDRPRRHRRARPSAASSSRTAAPGPSTTSATTSSSRGRRSTRCATARLPAMLRDVAYQARTPEFWNSMDMIGGPGELLDGRIVQRREGRTAAEQRGQPRLPARPVPRSDGRQHRQTVVSAAPSRLRRRLPPARAAKSLAAACSLFSKADEMPRQHRYLVAWKHAICWRRDHDRGRRHRHRDHRSRARSARRRASTTTNLLDDGSLPSGRGSGRATREPVARRSGADAEASARSATPAVDAFGDEHGRARSGAACRGRRARPCAGRP